MGKTEKIPQALKKIYDTSLNMRSITFYYTDSKDYSNTFLSPCVTTSEGSGSSPGP